VYCVSKLSWQQRKIIGFLKASSPSTIRQTDLVERILKDKLDGCFFPERSANKRRCIRMRSISAEQLKMYACVRASVCRSVKALIERKLLERDEAGRYALTHRASMLEAVK